MRVAFTIPTPQSEIVKIVQCDNLYTRLKGEVVCEGCCEDMFLFSKSMQLGGQFLLATNLHHRQKHYNTSFITTMEDNYKRIFVVYKTNNTNFHKYELIEYFIPKEDDFYFTQNEKDNNRKGWYQSYYAENIEDFGEKCPIEYSIGTNIEIDEVEFRKYNPNTRRYE